MQVVLLRFLETGEIQRIGADRSHVRVNVRLVTATNRDLPKEIAAGNFREDLFFRLNVIRMHIPPLRDRIEDVPLLFEHYLGTYCDQHRVERPQIAPGDVDALMAYRWPGNIRELRNVAERIALKTDRRVAARHGPARGARAASAARIASKPRRPTPARPLPASPVLAGGGDDRPHAAARRILLGDGLPALHVARPDPQRPPAHRRGRTRADQRKLSPAGGAVQHAQRRLQALPGLPAEAQLPPAVPAVPDRVRSHASHRVRGRSQAAAIPSAALRVTIMERNTLAPSATRHHAAARPVVDRGRRRELPRRRRADPATLGARDADVPRVRGCARLSQPKPTRRPSSSTSGWATTTACS